MRGELGSAETSMLVPAAGGERGYRKGGRGRIERMNELVSLPPGSSWAAKVCPVFPTVAGFVPEVCRFVPPICRFVNFRSSVACNRGEVL